MPLKSKILERIDLIFEMLRYAASGLTATAAYFVFAIFLHEICNIEALLASVTAYLLSGFISYIAQKGFTFRMGVGNKLMTQRFIVLFLIGFTINFVIVSLFKKYGLNPNFSYVLVCVIIPVMNYSAMKFWVFIK